MMFNGGGDTECFTFFRAWRACRNLDVCVYDYFFRFAKAQTPPLRMMPGETDEGINRSSGKVVPS